MKNIYLYTPEVCDGDYCPKDCDNCIKADAAMSIADEEEEDDGEL